MEMARNRCAEGLTTGLLLLALTASLCAQDRPLPEVAREKSGKTAARVLTNEDLEKGPRAEAPTPSAAVGSAAVRGEKSGGLISLPGLLDEATAGEASAILKSLRHDEEVLLRRYAQIEEKLSRENDPHLRQLYSDSLSRREETLARKREQISRVEKAIKAGERRRAASPGSQNEGEPKVQK